MTGGWNVQCVLDLNPEVTDRAVDLLVSVEKPDRL
jgi:hypothetical protein